MAVTACMLALLALIYLLHMHAKRNKVQKGAWKHGSQPNTGHRQVAATLTNPFDVAKTHRQMIMTGQVHDARSGTIDIVRSIVRRHGWQGLFAGLGPRVAKVAPACGVMIGTYETAKQYFAVRNRRGY